MGSGASKAAEPVPHNVRMPTEMAMMSSTGTMGRRRRSIAVLDLDTDAPNTVNEALECTLRCTGLVSENPVPIICVMYRKHGVGTSKVPAQMVEFWRTEVVFADAAGVAVFNTRLLLAKDASKKQLEMKVFLVDLEDSRCHTLDDRQLPGTGGADPNRDGSGRSGRSNKSSRSQRSGRSKGGHTAKSARSDKSAKQARDEKPKSSKSSVGTSLGNTFFRISARRPFKSGKDKHRKRDQGGDSTASPKTQSKSCHGDAGGERNAMRGQQYTIGPGVCCFSTTADEINTASEDEGGVLKLQAEIIEITHARGKKAMKGQHFTTQSAGMQIEFKTLSIHGLEHFVLDMGDDTLETLHKVQLCVAKNQKEKLVSLFDPRSAESLDMHQFNMICTNGTVLDDVVRCLGKKKNKKAKRLMDKWASVMKDRVHELTMTPHIVLIDCICAGISKISPTVQDLIAAIFRQTSGRQLYQLKDRLDMLGRKNMLDIIFDCISDSDIQTTLCKHFQKQALKLSKDVTFNRPIRVLSDIDDTLVHSGWGLGGPKFPAGSVLPGFLALVKELRARVIFITARPGFLKKQTYDKLISYGVENPNVITGVLSDSVLIPFAPSLSNDWISNRKFGSYVRYKRLFPECRFIWFGDSGQGDVQMGQKMLEEDLESMHAFKLEKSVIGCYIQDVTQANGIDYKTSFAERSKTERANNGNLWIVENYVDVALKMHEIQLLDKHSLQRVAQQAVDDLAEIGLHGFLKLDKKKRRGTTSPTAADASRLAIADRKSAGKRRGNRVAPSRTVSEGGADDAPRESGQLSSGATLKPRRRSSFSFADAAKLKQNASSKHGPLRRLKSARRGESSKEKKGASDPQLTWDARVAELRFSVSMVNENIASMSDWFAVSTDVLCDSGMAIVRYNDKLLVARHNYYTALETARKEYVVDIEHPDDDAVFGSNPDVSRSASIATGLTTPVIDISREHRTSTVELS